MLKLNIGLSPKSPPIELSNDFCRTELLSSFRVRIGGRRSKGILLWKWRTKPPKPPLPLGRRGPHLIQQCLGSPHAPLQTAAPTVEALLHTYAVDSLLDTMAHPKLATKLPLPVDRSPNPTTCLICGPVRPMMPNDIRIRSAVFHNALDRPTDRPTHVRTDRQRAPRATPPNNTYFITYTIGTKTRTGEYLPNLGYARLPN